LVVAALVVSSAAVAKADTLTYTLSEQGVSTPLATWTMSSTPTPNCPSQGLSPCYVIGDFFGLDENVYLDGSSTPTLDTLVFFNTSAGDVVLNDTDFFIPELTTTDPTQQLYSNNEANPEMVIPPSGAFTFGSDTPGFQDDVFILTVTTPEPGTITFVGLGLAGLLLFRRRQFAL